MRISHQQAVVPHVRKVLSAGSRTAMDRGELPNDSIVADLSPGLFALELEILRYGAQDGTGEDLAAPADPDIVENRHVRADPAVITDFHMLRDGHERRNHDIAADLGAGMDIGHIVIHKTASFIKYCKACVLVLCPGL